MKLGTLRNRIALNAAKHNAEVRVLEKKQSVAVSRGEALERVFRAYHREDYLVSDPLLFPKRYSDPFDQEVVALLSALLAYGRVSQIIDSVESYLARLSALGLSPRQWVESFLRPKDLSPLWDAHQNFAHRFNTGIDLFVLGWLISESWRDYGSVGAHLHTHFKDGQTNFAPALSGLIQDWRRRLEQLPQLFPQYFPKGAPSSFQYLLTDPRDGSTCKRWCMLLRWMVRSDGLDLGLWSRERGWLKGVHRFLEPSHLVMPLDTHTGRISKMIGLTQRKSLGWKAAVEITDSLREYDPNDPVKYDFALARLGILDLCQKRFRVEICQRCDLLSLCQFAQKGLSSSRSRSTSS